MSQSASQAAIFYRDVSLNGKLWTIKDKGGYPAPMTSSGRRAMPFWSSKSRAEKIIKHVEAYKYFEPEELNLTEFFNYWLIELKKDEQLVGVNWSGNFAVGFDIEPELVKRSIEAEKQEKKGFFKNLWRT